MSLAHQIYVKYFADLSRYGNYDHDEDDAKENDVYDDYGDKNFLKFVEISLAYRKQKTLH